MSLPRLLESQQQRLIKLNALLEDEQQALVAGTIDGARLEQIATGKAALFAAVEATESGRARVQERLGYPAGREGARQAAADAGCLEYWQATLEEAARTARLNDRNGRLISLRMTHNQQMLDFIHHITEKFVYASDGRTISGQRRLSTSA